MRKKTKFLIILIIRMKIVKENHRLINWFFGNYSFFFKKDFFSVEKEQKFKDLKDFKGYFFLSGNLNLFLFFNSFFFK